MLNLKNTTATLSSFTIHVNTASLSKPSHSDMKVDDFYFHPNFETFSQTPR